MRLTNPAVLLTMVVTAMLITFWTVIRNTDKSYMREAAVTTEKQKWFRDHACVVDYYVSGSDDAIPIYRCSDNRVYSWRDIPITHAIQQ